MAEVIYRIFCSLCGLREENGQGADLCAICQGEILNAMEAILNG